VDAPSARAEIVFQILQPMLAGIAWLAKSVALFFLVKIIFPA
jgi:hypothetical protein